MYDWEVERLEVAQRVGGEGIGEDARGVKCM